MVRKMKMSEDIIKCGHCPMQTKGNPHSGKDVIDAGFHFINSFRRSWSILCDTCYQKVRKLAEEILKYIPDKDLYFPALFENKE